ncbi:hypothetical protein [Saccharothrix syringae]|uniref:Ketohydroxyglutarate aldolase n=1 Tax=Saccharothrix syringae TaxID=103733 RepID=A0A5Q0GW61_SACSY|nr:hypothetical protein [Saccharothrix syringae]QFZ17700.1 hypothetical protein EKG83_09560 [Saccharothrix syringae]
MATARHKVVVSVADDGLADLPAVVSALRDAGMHVDDVMETLGVVTGSVDPQASGVLGTVPGVATVEVEREVGLPPGE